MAASAQLTKYFRQMKEDPVEGLYVELVADNVFIWRVYIEGPKGTPYAEGIFESILEFPTDFPMQPPTMRFVSKFWHPNVYEDGRVCISILHAPGDDPMSGEHSSERWRPTQTVQSILLSVISMISDPNTSSPANVDANIEFRQNNQAFVERVKKLAKDSALSCPSHVRIPHPDTDPKEREKAIRKFKLLSDLENRIDWMTEEVEDDIYEEDLEQDEMEDEDEDEE
ncbi:uncharacterized protein LOC126329989 isoform X2 [Schistocerca gregaria]|uniref:uncharacterized protein LOC126329989 isoform X2 n=1 Tax=Schistocerca gregaria TaxID=7010 RepID=UPI00211DC7B4|nr:uncharacterized protein LOC126329989 isoform X2 [Schistocerca gregaria]